MGKMPMQKKSIERIIAFAICSIEFIIIILILCINGYNSIKKPIGSTYCADQIFDVVNSDAISFFGTDFYGDGTYMDTKTREYRNYTIDPGESFCTITLDNGSYAIYDYKNTVCVITPGVGIKYYTRVGNSSGAFVLQKHDYE